MPNDIRHYFKRKDTGTDAQRAKAMNRLTPQEPECMPPEVATTTTTSDKQDQLANKRPRGEEEETHDDGLITPVQTKKKKKKLQCEHCDFTASYKCLIKRHMANVHDTDAQLFQCDQCAYSCKQKGNLKSHKANIHNTGVVLKKCDICSFLTKHASSLKQHKRDVHGVATRWFQCEYCNLEFKQNSHLLEHKRRKHNIGVGWVECDICNYRCTRPFSLKEHKARVHNIGLIVWHHCSLCNHQSKSEGDLKLHKAAIHDIGVTWKSCDLCHYQAKQKTHLQQHMQRHHNSEYIARKKVQEERVRAALLAAGYEEWMQTETLPPIGMFKREKKIDFVCANMESDKNFARIDFWIPTETGHVLLEVDENQHKYGYEAELSCDMKRMNNVVASIAEEFEYANTPNLFWLRYNPHAWRIDGELQKVPKVTREERLIKWLSECKIDTPLKIGYACYDSNDGMLEVLDNEHFSPHYAEVVEMIPMHGDACEPEETAIAGIMV